MRKRKTLSLDLRERILACYDAGEGTREDMAKRFRVSLGLVNKTISRRIVSATVLSIAALLVTAGLTALVVGYALRPLRRVAVTAAEGAGDSAVRNRAGPPVAE